MSKKKRKDQHKPEKAKYSCAGRGWHGRIGLASCSNNGKYHEGGKWWCWHHQPSKIKAHEVAAQEKYDEESERNEQHWRRRQAERDACEGMPTEALEAGVVKDLLIACEAIVLDIIEHCQLEAIISGMDPQIHEDGFPTLPKLRTIIAAVPRQ